MHVSQIFDPGLATGGNEHVTDFSLMDTTMAGYITSAVYDADTPAVFDCNGETYSSPTFAILGVCGSCQTVTSQTQAYCPDGLYRKPQSCRYRTPGDYTPSASFDDYPDVSDQTWFNSTGRFIGSDTIPIMNTKIASFGAIQIPKYNWLPNLTTFFPEVPESSLRWCTQTLKNVAVRNGTYVGEGPFQSELDSNQESQRFWLARHANHTYRESTVLSISGEATHYVGNRSFTINHNDHVITGKFLADLLATGSKSGGNSAV